MVERGDQPLLSQIPQHIQAFSVLVLSGYQREGTRPVQLEEFIFRALSVHDSLIGDGELEHPAASYLRSQEQGQLDQLRTEGILIAASMVNLIPYGTHLVPEVVEGVKAMDMQRRFGLKALHPAVQRFSR